ncbi:hypothetical protein BB559_001495 [Furculomyces boomerangus]|uniref:Uncharacterized protein n=2 Tax=Harpellales TaxID=61421 RepID=A0A2T9Z1P9_9FUNG|nr:hypothetical protein BB559_001495 [Furculomyces boomerangus]PVZ98523.1 hypothetical protein BB558_005493 [Smittium angustum]PWA01713.1 hypothetical protein BB558_002171 [Smittium angustum]
MTLGWGCGCKDREPDVNPWDWPVVARDCQGNMQVCKLNCNNTKGRSQDCFVDCDKVWKCNTMDSPVSYTNVTNVNDKPAYSGPEVTYSGNIPGTNITAPVQITSTKETPTTGKPKNAKSSGKSEKTINIIIFVVCLVGALVCV